MVQLNDRSFDALVDALERGANRQDAILESEIRRLEAVLWSIGHAAGVETKEDLMKAARDAIEKPTP